MNRKLLIFVNEFEFQIQTYIGINRIHTLDGNLDSIAMGSAFVWN